MDWFDILGYVGGILMFSTFYMKTMIPLRIVGISANVMFILYAAIASVYPVLVLQACLLPLNIVRLVQMRRLIRRVDKASNTEFDLTALIPFMSPLKTSAGEELFKKGDDAKALYLIESGKVRLIESNKEMGPGDLFGEVGILSPYRRRTESVVCEEDCEMLMIDSDKVMHLYYQNPDFGFYLVRLVTNRLLGNLEDLRRDADPSMVLP